MYFTFLSLGNTHTTAFFLLVAAVFHCVDKQLLFLSSLMDLQNISNLLLLQYTRYILNMQICTHLWYLQEKFLEVFKVKNYMCIFKFQRWLLHSGGLPTNYKWDCLSLSLPVDAQPDTIHHSPSHNTHTIQTGELTCVASGIVRMWTEITCHIQAKVIEKTVGIHHSIFAFPPSGNR